MRVQLLATCSGLPSAHAIVTGPSRSADIEKRLALVAGVITQVSTILQGETRQETT
jgi:hypothetical protein